MKRLRFFYISENLIIKYFDFSVDYENGEINPVVPLPERAFMIDVYSESEPENDEEHWIQRYFNRTPIETTLRSPFISSVIDHLQPYMFREVNSTILVSL